MERRPPGSLREVYGAFAEASAPALLPSIAMLGWSRFAKAQPQALAAHQHPNCWEICYRAIVKCCGLAELGGLFFDSIFERYSGQYVLE